MAKSFIFVTASVENKDFLNSGILKSYVDIPYEYTHFNNLCTAQKKAICQARLLEMGICVDYDTLIVGERALLTDYISHEYSEMQRIIGNYRHLSHFNADLVEFVSYVKQKVNEFTPDFTSEQYKELDLSISYVELCENLNHNSNSQNPNYIINVLNILRNMHSNQSIISSHTELKKNMEHITYEIEKISTNNEKIALFPVENGTEKTIKDLLSELKVDFSIDYDKTDEYYTPKQDARDDDPWADAWTDLKA